eukprot:CAMPEP_0204303170 /NCGR_PEP_ID=MMETSP0468-20130131/83397_1 /ASSEMBLY_ACC=CAM_ASM_000383 /TAXON_ID=2969 /ORGANISM="Oxyrrhis marina" /LENGTH=47 /DNA_ID= /DNA_START= /DNA_END= /DNA_ORIENTATION=
MSAEAPRIPNSVPPSRAMFAPSISKVLCKLMLVNVIFTLMGKGRRDT